MRAIEDEATEPPARTREFAADDEATEPPARTREFAADDEATEPPARTREFAADDEATEPPARTREFAADDEATEPPARTREFAADDEATEPPARTREFAADDEATEPPARTREFAADDEATEPPARTREFAADDEATEPPARTREFAADDEATEPPARTREFAADDEATEPPARTREFAADDEATEPPARTREFAADDEATEPPARTREFAADDEATEPPARTREFAADDEATEPPARTREFAADDEATEPPARTREFAADDEATEPPARTREFAADDEATEPPHIRDFDCAKVDFSDNPILDNFFHKKLTPEDYEWSVRALNEVVRPGVKRGMNRDDFRELDERRFSTADSSRHVPLRSYAPIYDFFYGSEDCIKLYHDSDGVLRPSNGRHRIEMARRLGIEMLPGRISNPSDSPSQLTNQSTPSIPGRISNPSDSPSQLTNQSTPSILRRPSSSILRRPSSGDCTLHDVRTRYMIGGDNSNENDDNASDSGNDYNTIAEQINRLSVYQNSERLADLLLRSPGSFRMLREIGGEAYWSKKYGRINVNLGRQAEFSNNRDFHTHLSANLDTHGCIHPFWQITDRRIAAIYRHLLVGELIDAKPEEIKQISEALQQADPIDRYRDLHPKKYKLKRRQQLTVESFLENTLEATDALNLQYYSRRLDQVEVFDRYERGRIFIELINEESKAALSLVDCRQSMDLYERTRVEVAKRLLGIESSGKTAYRVLRKKKAVRRIRKTLANPNGREMRQWHSESAD